MELPDTTSGVPLVLVRSIKIQPGGNLEVPLECTRQLTDQMDISHRIYINHYTSYTLYAELQAKSNKSLQPWQ